MEYSSSKPQELWSSGNSTSTKSDWMKVVVDLGGNTTADFQVRFELGVE